MRSSVAHGSPNYVVKCGQILLLLVINYVVKCGQVLLVVVLNCVVK